MFSAAALDSQHIAQLIAALEKGNVVHYTHVSTACLVVYDYVTTLDEEVALVWRARWGAGKILYLLSRYPIWPEMAAIAYSNLFSTNPRVCQVLFTYFSWSALAGITIAEVILIVRTWALWGAKRAMLVSLAALLACITVSNGYLMSQFVNNAIFISAATYLPGAGGCVLTTTSHRIAIAWLSVTVFELSENLALHPAQACAPTYLR
ncbi:hypothetical protein AURDEDRAFT_165014 [Auricularia subglabra TFB-10046 SS5]|nr:hypothetical protein AURDEDRAFT_165014 [Auricularia subglabra TFB-10046 SS5]